MSLIQLIERVLGLSSERRTRPVAIPVIERVEGRQMMAFTGGVFVGVGDLDGDGAAITDGTSNTIMIAERQTSSTGAFFLRNTNNGSVAPKETYLQYKLEDVLISSYQL